MKIFDYRRYLRGTACNVMVTGLFSESCPLAVDLAITLETSACSIMANQDFEDEAWKVSLYPVNTVSCKCGISSDALFCVLVQHTCNMAVFSLCKDFKLHHFFTKK